MPSPRPRQVGLRRRFTISVAVAAAAAAWAAVATPDPAAGQVSGGGTVRPDSAAKPRPPLAACPLGARLGAVRDEGACVRARQTLLPPPGPAHPDASTGAPTLRTIPWELRSAWRSSYPADRNDGLLWSGRGVSAALSGGLEAGWRGFTVVLAPEVAWSANRAFQLPDTASAGWSRYADPWNTPGLDRFLRPGGRSVTWWGWGDSYVEAGLGPARLGLSNERLWWGPARRYPLLFSGTSAGFAHVYAESDGELPLGPGGVTVRLLGGHLEESGWFDADAGNDRRLLAAGQAAWRLGFVPGLEVALSLVRHEPLPDGGSGTGSWGHLLTGDPGDEPPELRGSSLGTLSFRVALPGDGMEAYGEVGRGEMLTNGIAGVSESAHALLYTLGMTRSDVSAGGRRWRVWGELTKQELELPQPAASGAAVTLRAPALPHGHTHRGQLLGSWIGPGSNAQMIGVDFPGDAGSLGFLAERVRRDDDTYYRVHTINYGVLAYDLEWTLGARGARTLSLGGVGTLQIHGEGGISRRKNRSFVGLDRGKNWTWVREWNRWVDVRLLWIPG